MILDYSMAQRRKVVSFFDSAIDRERSRLAEYLQDGHPAGWLEYLVLLEGRQPVLWELRPLDVDEVTAATAAHRWQSADGRSYENTELIHAEAFRRAVTGWTGLRLRRDGQLEEMVPSFEDAGPGQRILTAACVRELSRLARPIVQELGKCAMKSAVLEEKAKN